MGIKTGISWCDATWNPWMGCSPVASGCAHCYARREMTRYGRDFSAVTRAKPSTFNLPLKLAPGTRVFVCSWSDFFHEAADAWRMDAWEIMAKRPDLTFIIPTKRPERMKDSLPWYERVEHTTGTSCAVGRPWSHVWGLVSASTQPEADVVIPQLLDTAFSGRGVSLEPLLGAVDLYRGGWSFLERVRSPSGHRHEKLDWVIVGGESGGPPERALVERICACGDCASDHDGRTGRCRMPDDLCHGFEPCRSFRPSRQWEPKPEALSWVRSLRDQCQAAGVPFHFKQWGGPRPDSAGRLLDGREWAEDPARTEGK